MPPKKWAGYKLVQEIEWLVSFKVDRGAIPDRLHIDYEQLHKLLQKDGYEDIWVRYVQRPTPEAESWWNWQLNKSRRPRAMRVSA